ncbi:MAG: hypothetical protein KF678_08175 [Phycisphaeraceae bacterium]|nr:hypothetical protein [Phycisphaeraceae bacterium]
MNLKLRRESAPATAEGSPSGLAPSIAGWLGVLGTMLPRRQAAAIREELESHLQERVRDLMVGGLAEAEATRRAIAELGEAAELASKYRALSIEPQRRLVMYGLVVAVAGAGLALGVAAVSGGGRQPILDSTKTAVPTGSDLRLSVQPGPHGSLELVVQPPGAGAARTELPIVQDLPIMAEAIKRGSMRVYEVQPAASELDALRAEVDFDRTPMADVLKFIGERAGMPVQVNWSRLADLGLDPKSPVTLKAKSAGMGVILRAINEAIASSSKDDGVDWRATNGVIEVATRSYFDRREVKLVIYELEGIIAARHDTYGEERVKVMEEVIQLIQGFVFPSGWQDNGGDLAKLTVVGDRMFVEAPARFQTQIRWMLDQLPAKMPQ